MMKGSITLAVLALAMLFSSGGCARQTLDHSLLVWPAAPSEPMIVFERSIYGSQSLQRSFFGRFKDFLLGASPERELSKPYGLAFDGGSKLYAADTAQKAILILDIESGHVTSFSSMGRHGRLQEPVNVAVDGHGHVFVADTGLGRVVRFDADGAFVGFVGEATDLDAPVGLAYHAPTMSLYVVDTQQHKVKIFDHSGHLKSEFGSRGDERGEFYHPLGIEISKDGTVYVVDAFHFAVQAFTLAGDYAFSFGPRRNGVGSMARPRSIAIDGDDHLYVTDALRHNVQIYDASGARLMELGVSGFEPGQFRLPAGICITDDGRIFVADSINRRIQQFRYVRASEG